MSAIHYLKYGADFAFRELTTALEGVTEAQSWAVLPNLGPDYLHSDASIHGITLHIAIGKKIYGSIGFRNTELRWSDLAREVEAIEPSWEKALAYLNEAHDYWMASWGDLHEDDLEELRPCQQGRLEPIRWHIAMLTHHDSYHAGQIAMLRYGVAESDVVPPSVTADIRQYCSDSQYW